jgi:Mrp family chromosome partitioning ATPase
MDIKDSATLPRSMGDVYEVDAEFVWQDKVPAATVTVFAAKGGSGKSLVCADLAARVAMGSDMPDGTPGLGKPSNVLYVSMEDSPEFSLKARLRSAGADDEAMERIFDLSENPDGMPFDLTRDYGWLCELASDLAPRLIIIDNLGAAYDGSTSSVRAVRNNVTGPLLRLASQGPAVLLVHHLTKDGKVGGSAAVVDSVRQVLALEADVADARIKQVVTSKSNCADLSAPSPRFRIVDGPCLEWLDSTAVANSPQGADSARALTLAALANSAEALSAQEIAAQTGVSYATTKVTLSRAVRAGLVVSQGMNLYAEAA